MWKQEASVWVYLYIFLFLFSVRQWKLCYDYSSHWCKQDSKVLRIKASASWCTVSPGLLENKIPKFWKVCSLDGAAYIWQQLQNVLLFYTRMTSFFFLPWQCKNFWKPGNTSVSSENHLSMFTTFASYSVLSVQLPVFCWFKSQLSLPLLASGDTYSCSPAVQNY